MEDIISVWKRLWPTSRKSQNICITFIQRPNNIFDVGLTLYKCYTNVLCLLCSRKRLIKSVIMNLSSDAETVHQHQLDTKSLFLTLYDV